MPSKNIPLARFFLQWHKSRDNFGALTHSAAMLSFTVLTCHLSLTPCEKALRSPASASSQPQMRRSKPFKTALVTTHDKQAATCFDRRCIVLSKEPIRTPSQALPSPARAPDFMRRSRAALFLSSRDKEAREPARDGYMGSESVTCLSAEYYTCYIGTEDGRPGCFLPHP